MKLLSACTIAVCLSTVRAQTPELTRKPREFDRTFQLALFPGISTNGISSGSYINDYSLNLLGGLSAGNRIFEAGLITNVNLNSITGIQIAGLANIVGANTFLNLTLSEQRQLEHAGFESNSHGIQLAGFLNYVRMNAKGIQASGAFNIAGFDFQGLQLAGLGNSAGDYMFGTQIATVYNIAAEGMGGMQVSLLLNYTRGQLSGTQIALINKAVRMKGRKSTPPDGTHSLQVGLINFAKEMGGMQIGLINFGGSMRGVQFGLINFFRRSPFKENVHAGIPIGLVNVGSKGSYFRLSFNEIFPVNAEFSTGNCHNCTAVLGSEMPYNENWKKYNQNALMAGYNINLGTWAFGYGFQRVLFNKVFMIPRPENERKMISYGVKFLHLNRSMDLDRTFNLVNRFNLDYGIRRKSIHFFIGMAISYFLYDASLSQEDYRIASVVLPAGKVRGLNSALWPGYQLGLHF